MVIIDMGIGELLIIIIIMRGIYIAHKNVKPLAKRMTSILRHVAEVFPPARQGAILNYHRVVRMATNTSMVLNCALISDLHIFFVMSSWKTVS